MKKSLVVFCAIFLAACGQSLSGTYADSSGVVEYKFESGGKVTTKTMGMEAELKYELDGKKVKFLTPGGALVYTLQDDGSMAGPMGLKLIKKK